MTNVATELRRAKKIDDANVLYQEAVVAAIQPESIAGAMALAAERGDVDGCLALFDKFERLQAGKPFNPSASNNPIASPPDSLGKLMSVRAKDKAWADIMKILDHYLDQARKRPTTAGKSKVSKMYTSIYGGNSYQVWVGTSQNYTQIDYPLPNEYADYGAILLLRSAFEHFKRADLLSDLTGHFQAAAAKAPANEKIYSQLPAAYLSYWNDDRDEALASLSKAVEMVPNDTDLKLDLATLRTRREASATKALALADSIEPLDNATMQKKETLALRLAVQNGDVDRARKAAERLFNLGWIPRPRSSLPVRCIPWPCTRWPRP